MLPEVEPLLDIEPEPLVLIALAAEPLVSPVLVVEPSVPSAEVPAAAPSVLMLELVLVRLLTPAVAKSLWLLPQALSSKVPRASESRVSCKECLRIRKCLSKGRLSIRLASKEQ